MMTENRIELFIETLTGTAFELSCSPLEPIVSIKAKIQYLEGIPVSQQHLIWKSQELNDDLCLHDYNITNGATLKLVLGMRGGPINTKQVASDSKGLKDIADYVERQSETSGSTGRPFTVLVFHDGDKVRMYTLMEQGECTVSPLSGTLSETSSITSIKNVEETDQEIIKENEITKEKIARLQEQIRALNLNRSRRVSAAVQMQNSHKTNIKVKEKAEEVLRLPPLHMNNIDSQTKSLRSHSKMNKVSEKASYFSRFTPNLGNKSLLKQNGSCEYKEIIEDQNKSQMQSNILNSKDNSFTSNIKCQTKNLSSQVLTSPEFDSREHSLSSSSSFLPYIESRTSTVDNKPVYNLSPQVLSISVNSPCITSVIKYQTSNLKNMYKPITTQEFSNKKFLDLDNWIQNRPKTTPNEVLCKPLNFFLDKEILSKSKLKENGTKCQIKPTSKQPFSMSLPTNEKSHFLMKAKDVDCDKSTTAKNKYISQEHSKIGIITAEMKEKQYLSLNSEMQEMIKVSSQGKNGKCTSKNEEKSRPISAKKLPFIKAKKKSYKRCTLCNKKTGLATSFTCRCGKNFCASHRYAETHQCSYDYKTEGRRLLYLNNPVIAASKLPKI